MAATFPSDQPHSARDRANAEQSEASDPAVSAFVAANAGSGKTRVLTDRLLRLMLGGAAPGRIQCLTFTKAAAAEMALRLQATLGRWVTLDEAALDGALRGLQVPPTAAKRQAARALFAQVLDVPGGMRIGTIHSFCQGLLRRFPLEAALSPRFQLVEDTEAAEELSEAREAVLAGASGGGGLGGEVDTLAGLVSAGEFARLTAALHGKVDRLAWLFDLPEAGMRGVLRRALSLTARSDAELLDRAVSWPDEDAVRRALGIAQAQGTPAVRDRSQRLLDWLALPAAGRAARWEAGWLEELLTKSGAPRAASAFAAKTLAEKHPDIHAQVQAEQHRVLAVEDGRRALREAEASAALLALAAPVLRGYAARKQSRGFLDYADLIGRALYLLRDPGAAWVLYKLDGGMDHLLLDEVQDTAPEQWRIAHALTEEFFAGMGADRGADRDNANRTFFAVGDLKQSIYSFQGADPAEFGRSRAAMRGRVEASGQSWRDVALDVSFRSTAPVLHLVDAVFADGPARWGVSTPEDPDIHHYADRADQAGRVELWPLAPVPAQPEREPWMVPDTNEGLASAPQTLADGIAAWLAEQLNEGVLLPSRGRPLRPGDVLVLVRRRGAFATGLVRALKSRGVAVAGLDRLVLTEQPAVQDLLALCDVLLLPQDDLQLACVLTSPLGGLSDDSLMRLAMDRPGTLWDALRDRAGERAVWGEAWRFVSALLARADHVTPHALLAEALGPLGGRARLLARLGPEAAEPVDELLGAALRYTALHPPSLQGFVHWLRHQSAEIKRESEQAGGTVRVMTVHGAKGLEAPVVILPDTTQDFGRDETFAWLRDPQTGQDVPVWSPRKPLRSRAVDGAVEGARSLRRAELNRLLYVALTRAADRLVICGWETKRPTPENWYELVRAGFERLGARAEPFEGVGGAWSGDRLVLDSPQMRAAPLVPRVAAPAGAALPSWAGTAPHWRPAPPPVEPPLPVPLAPSRPDGAGLGPVPGRRSPLMSGLDGASPRRFLRGQIAHRLLQHLPDLPPMERDAAAGAYAAQPGHGLDPKEAARLAVEVLAVLDDPALVALFGPGSRAEQPLAGVADGRVINGVVDRLAVLPDQVLLADYKTDRDPPDRVEETPVLYLRQLAAYRAVLRLLYPGRPVRCWLVWTDGCRVVPMPDAVLDRAAGPHAMAAGLDA